MNTDIAQVSHVHFIGIGGIGMSALARLFLHEKKHVSGSDRSETRVTKALVSEGVTFFNTQVPENIAPDVDLVVYTDAMPQDHPELDAARTRGITTMSYFEALGLIANQYHLIAVAGTHGKTTTTAMLVDIFEEAGLDPTAIVGSLRAKTQSNFRAGKSKYFIVEADEYRRHFLHFTPTVLVITNIEADHLDYYKDLADVQSAFRELAERVPEDGAIICVPSDPVVGPVVATSRAKVFDYGRYFKPLLPLAVLGMHNYQNAAAAGAAADITGISERVAEKALSAFTGTWRRFEYKGVMPKGAHLYDDYAHHPTEIRATLKAAREHFADARIIVAFHPHLYSRTKLLFDDFAGAFNDADEVIIAPIFAAREEDDGTITNQTLADAITARGVEAIALPSFDAIAERLKARDGEHTVIITMGAGDIYQIATQLL